MSEKEVPDTQFVKQSLCYRAKYLKCKLYLSCSMLVPHPKNRGGDPIRAARAKALCGEIIHVGYLHSLATLDSVCVEVDVDENGAYMSTFSDHFRANAGQDPDHWVGNENIRYAGLSHNSKNLTERNMKHRMPGCACDPPAPSLEKCSCKAKPLLMDIGGQLVYDLDKLLQADKEWFTNLMAGCEWEVLSSKMDIEEPTAAHIIALALNSSNQIALETGHLEIMRTLMFLCNPDPHTLEVSWDKVRSAMYPSIGKSVDGSAYYPAFQLMATSGGRDSASWADFFRW